MKKAIYLASPYTDTNYFAQEKRVFVASYVSAKIMEEGFICYSPVLMGHAMCNLSTKLARLPSEEWGDFCERLLKATDELWVLCIDGWKKSIGVSKEIEWAKELGMPIRYIDKNLEELDFSCNQKENS